MRPSYMKRFPNYAINIYLLRCALSAGSLLRTTRRLAAVMGRPESTSWMTILMASPSTEACLLGASSSSRAAADHGVGGRARSAAMSGLEERNGFVRMCGDYKVDILQCFGKKKTWAIYYWLKHMATNQSCTKSYLYMDITLINLK